MPQNVDPPGHSRMEYAQYVTHLKKYFDVDISHFHKHVGPMTDGYLKVVADAHSQLRAILNLEHGTSGFG